jgi:ribonuclease D
MEQEQPPMQELHVETSEQLKLLCERLCGSPWLALDTEFMRERTYTARLCLLQVSNGEIAASVDSLRLDSLQPLLEIIYDPKPVKVFHSGRQDLEIFHQLWGRLPSPIFDTQLAATLLGLGEQVGYAKLVQQLLGQQLEKSHTRTDWSQRPLEQAQLRYALDDVIYLGKIYLLLDQRLRELGRDQWLQEDFLLLTSPATYAMNPDQAWQRVKGWQRLKGVQLAVLQALAGWREEQAQRADKPRRWIIKDDPLLELTRRRPTDTAQLGRIRGLEPGTLKRHGTTLLKLIADAARLPKSAWPQEKPASPRLTPNQEAITDLLSCSLRLLADQAGITPTALASHKELERLVSGERELGILHGWRSNLAGAVLLEVLEGKLIPRMAEGKLSLKRASDDHLAEAHRPRPETPA